MAVPEQNSLLFTFVAGSAFVLLLVVAFLIVFNRSQKKIAREQEKLHKEREENQRLLLEAILRAQEAERKRIARELHDEIGQLATVQKINLTLFRRKITSGINPNDLADLVNEVDTMIQDANDSIQSVKRIIHDLRPMSIEETGLISEVRNLLDRIQVRTGIDTFFQANITYLELKEEKAVEIFRIVQEAITNILRHAGATLLEVNIILGNGDLTVSVKDNGRGIEVKDTTNPKSFGLRGMEERASLIGGQLRINKAKEKGTVVTLQLPVN